MTRTGQVLLAICFLVIAAHIWGAVDPSHWNWGVHLFGLYPAFVAWTALALSAAMFFPNARRKTLRSLERVAGKFASLPVLAVLGILSVALIISSLAFRAKLHLLGDGALLLRVISGLTLKDETPPAFAHQPLVEVIFRQIRHFSQTLSLANPETTFLVIDIAMGLVFLIILTLFLRTLRLSPVDKTLLGCILFFCGGSQFFFGYVELYVFLYTMTACYLITGWLALEHRLHVFVPVVCYGIMAGLHLGSAILFPSLLVLVYGVWRERRLEAAMVVGLGAFAFLAIVIVRDIDFTALLQRFAEERTANLLPLLSTDRNFVNPMVSLNHLLDWMNHNLLVAPFGFLPTAVLLVALRKHFRRDDVLFWFLIAASLCGILFTYAISAGLGMARDWDFLASFLLPLVLLNTYLLKLYLASEEGKSIVAAIAVLAFLHWVAWIGVNASEERHLQRAKLLDNPRLLGHVAQLNYFETLGAFFYSRRDYRQARDYFDHYVAIESSYVRVLANVAELYKKLGNEEKEFHYLQRAVMLQTRNPSVYMDLGVLYAGRGDTTSAIAVTQRAVEIDSAYAKAHANIAILYFLTGRFGNAAGHYVKAIDLGLQEPFLYRDAGSCFFFLERYDEALAYYDQYLHLVPGDNNTRKICETLRQLVPGQKTP